MCLVGLAVAQLPVWQLAQVPGTTPLCVNSAGSQAEVRWQASHESAVGRWLAGLAVALPPGAWHDTQPPGATPTWVKGVPAAGTPIPVPAGRTAGPPAERRMGRRAAAAAAAPPKLLVLWQLMQSWLVVLPWWLPTVAVLSDTPYHFAPLGP